MSWIGAASGATLGYIMGNVPGAVAGGYYGYNARGRGNNLPQNIMDAYPTPVTGNRKRKLSFSARRNSVAKKMSFGKPKRKASYKAPLRLRGGRRRSVRRRRTRGVRSKKSPGPYTGTFAKGVKKNKNNNEAYYLSKGTHRTFETFGTVADPNSVMIIHSTAYLNEIGFAIRDAMVRTLMDKAGFRITNNFVEIAATDPVAGANAPENSNGLRFVYTRKNALSGEYTNAIYDVPDNFNFDALTFSLTMISDHIISYIRDTADDEPYKLAVYKRDVLDPTDYKWNLAAEMFLEDSYVDIFTQSTLVVQNRTQAAFAGAGVLDTDRVDTQPITGWIYDFKNGDPRVRHMGNANNVLAARNNYLFGFIPDTGCHLIKGSQYVGANEPFDPKYFANVASATRVLLQPGEMKKTYFTWTVKGKMVNTLKKLKVKQWEVANLHASGCFGKSQMIMFEELMRTAGTNKITLGYEREFRTGCVVKLVKKQALFETILGSAPLDNV